MLRAAGLLLGLALAAGGCTQEFVIAILDGDGSSEASATGGSEGTSAASTDDAPGTGVADATTGSTDGGPERTSTTHGSADGATTSATDVTGSSSTGDTGPGECLPVRPGTGKCPAECTGGCAEGACAIACGVAECNSGTIGCPDGWPCVVDCTADNSCANATIECGDSGCEIVCAGLNSCLATTVVCGPQACSISCSAGAGMLDAFECAACSCESPGCLVPPQARAHLPSGST